ncbi:MAG: transcriptional activator RfaH [Burkholderiales bacterium]|nr:transcriptional activator RfaH [Burkholderiales bacterium]
MSLEIVHRIDNPDPVAIDSESLWFLAHTRPRLETVALQNLQQQGFEAYLPLYKRLKKIDASMQAVFEPMFSRYVFFRTTRAAQSIAPVRSTRGVAQIVSFGSEFATIRPDLLDAIRKIEQVRNAADVAELSSLRPGNLVRFCSSALNGLEGVVKSVSSSRVAVLFEVMGRQQLIHVDHHQLEAA